MTEAQNSCDPCAGLNLSSTTAPVTNSAVPTGAKTSDYYRTFNIPDRFEHPDIFQGYPTKQPHPMYRTTNAQYGTKPPTVHTVPTAFHAKSQSFSNHLGTCGMYRNHSLNCSSDKSNVPDH